MKNKNIYKNANKNPVSVNGILNINWFKEEAAKMTQEKEAAILKRNDTLASIPVEKRTEWLQSHPLKDFYTNNKINITNEEDYDYDK